MVNLENKINNKPKPLYQKGELVLYNPNKRFHNNSDQLFHIRERRYGTCGDILKKQWWYSGNLLEIKKLNREDIKETLAYSTSLSNVEEECITTFEPSPILIFG